VFLKQLIGDGLFDSWWNYPWMFILPLILYLMHGILKHQMPLSFACKGLGFIHSWYFTEKQ